MLWPRPSGPRSEGGPGIVRAACTVRCGASALVRRRGCRDEIDYDPFSDDGVYCRSRSWLLAAYVVSTAAVVGSVFVMLHHFGSEASAGACCTKAVSAGSWGTGCGGMQAWATRMPPRAPADASSTHLAQFPALPGEVYPPPCAQPGVLLTVHPHIAQPPALPCRRAMGGHRLRAGGGLHPGQRTFFLRVAVPRRRRRL